MAAYEQWCENNDIKAIEQTVEKYVSHWRRIAEEMLQLHQQDAKHCSVAIENLVNENRI